MRHEKISIFLKKGNILLSLFFYIVFIMPGVVYAIESQECDINCNHYEMIYESINLGGHEIFIEPNPGGGAQCSYAADDAAIVSLPDHGEVISNPNLRNVWINAIGAKKFRDTFPDGKNIVLTAYRYSGEFRLPKLPAPDDTQIENAEAVHFMIQLFDGANTLLQTDNHSLEFSILWKLNPWTDDYGKIFVYTGDPINNIPGVFETQLELEPDLEWHTFEMIVNFNTLKWVSISIDGIKQNLCDLDVAKVKHDDWGDDLFLSITTESQSSWPQYNCEKIFSWKTEFKNLEFGYWPAFIDSNKTRLTFASIPNKTVSNPQSVLISNSGCGTMDWTVSNNSSWLNCTPSSGTSPGFVSFSADPKGLDTGSYTGTITVTSVNSSNSPQTIPVTLNVYNLNQTSPPFGDFSTPLDGSTVSSSIPVTGWVLDDIEVESVKIYYENSGSLTYIGDAKFVEGARPDVELTYPNYPMNYKAGWGYIMLTNFLPNSGNGVFKLHAIATDADGHIVTLGTKTIICDNANAIKPFGAIDTPTQGGYASGSNFIHWGWTLASQFNCIPTDGSTINVYIDGVNLGHPAYNIYRSDIASLFADYCNSNGAAGYFNLDTTEYENGVHTIQWTAKDNTGNTDGIGSRYFIIENTGKNATSTKSSTLSADVTINLSQPPVNDLEPVEIMKGFNQDNSLQKVFPDENGNINIIIQEIERVKIELGSPGWRGIQVVGNKFKPIPVGSTLHNKKDIFFWQPGAGFIGDYQLVFIDNSGTKLRKINIKIEPMKSIK